MQRRHFPLYAADGTGGGAGGDGGSGGGAAGQEGGSGSGPWYKGVDQETVGFWQNKGLELDDPAKFATKLTEQYRAAERHIGVPPDRIIKLPEKNDDVQGWNGVWQRLGVPADAKDYDLSGVKFGDGTDLDAAFTDKMRAALASAHVPKDQAPTVVKAVVEYLDGADSAEAAERTAKLEAEKADLKKNWGQNFDFNKLTAMEGARRLGIPAEAIAALEKEIGYAATMEAMRKVGAGTKEDAFHDSGGGRGATMTQAGAVARKQELMADKAWVDRYLAGGAAEKREMFAIDQLISGVTDAAA